MISNFRYNNNIYRKCGNSGLMLPALSLGLWHNFGEVDSYKNAKEIALTAFNLGITHFDIANNYGPPPGSAEECFGKLLKQELSGYRDELIITTKAGYEMWNGPYGNWGSRKSLIASLNQSLRRLDLDYVDIFYHHRRDLNTPIEETMGALADIVRQGKALYIGISNYNEKDTEEAFDILNDLGVKLTIHQPRYNMFRREPEKGLFQTLHNKGIGSAVFCPLEQGLLTNKYLKGITKDSRAAKSKFLTKHDITKNVLAKVVKLNEIANKRGQSLAQMAMAWNIRPGAATSVIMGASRSEQIVENVKALENADFSAEELNMIDTILEG